MSGPDGGDGTGAKMVGDIKAITFDARGTLVKVRRPVGESYAAIARRHGADLPVAVIEDAFRSVFPSMPPLAFPPMSESELHAREQQWWRTLVQRVVEKAGSVDDFDSFFRDLYAVYKGAEAWKPYREAASVLCLLRSSRFKLGLISNFDSRIEEILVALNLSIWFDSVVFSSRTGVSKPHPGIFERSLAELQVEPHEALHVGDSYDRDYRGATAAGMRALLLDREGHWESRVPPGVERVERLDGVLEAVGVTGFARFAEAHAS